MMRILKEAAGSAPNYKAACDLIAGKSAQSLVDLLTGKADKNDSETVIKALTDVAVEIRHGGQKFPKTKSKFIIKYLSNQNGLYSLDFKKLVRDKECNPLSILGLLSIPLYEAELNHNTTLNPTPYNKFLSMFSEDGNFDNLSYILLGEFTEAFNVDNIESNNEFIKVYLKSKQKLFTEKTKTRKQFEKVYNSYVNDPVFDINSIKKILKRVS